MSSELTICRDLVLSIMGSIGSSSPENLSSASSVSVSSPNVVKSKKQQGETEVKRKSLIIISFKELYITKVYVLKKNACAYCIPAHEK